MTEEDGATIVFDNVRLNRGGKPLFEGLSLTLGEHRIGLIGDNGSGKSSLLRLCNGLLLPDSGRVRVCDCDTAISRNSIPALAGFLFQNPDHQIIFPTVIEELAFGLRERGSSSSHAKADARDMLALYGISEWAERPVHELSDGQKQLVCILAVTITQPRVLLFDEPFSSLDLPTRYRLMEQLGGLPQQIVMASHDLDLLRDFDRVIWIADGRVRHDGEAGVVIDAYRSAASALCKANAKAEP